MGVPDRHKPGLDGTHRRAVMVFVLMFCASSRMIELKIVLFQLLKVAAEQGVGRHHDVGIRHLAGTCLRGACRR